MDSTSTALKRLTGTLIGLVLDARLRLVADCSADWSVMLTQFERGAVCGAERSRLLARLAIRSGNYHGSQWEQALPPSEVPQRTKVKSQIEAGVP